MNMMRPTPRFGLNFLLKVEHTLESDVIVLLSGSSEKSRCWTNSGCR